MVEWTFAMPLEFILGEYSTSGTAFTQLHFQLKTEH